MSALAKEVTRFRQWAIVRQSGDYQYDQYSHGAEWECDYPDWQALYAAVSSFLETAASHTLTADELELVLYALARDNEVEVILERLQEFPAVALQVVQAAVSFPDIDARWQAAVLAGQIGATVIVRRFLDDDAEYVRRRAGFALREMENFVDDFLT
jgi:HEAT repeat protein